VGMMDNAIAIVLIIMKECQDRFLKKFPPINKLDY
jgi:hypothetical protein